jgi:hypothetical protein
MKDMAEKNFVLVVHSSQNFVEGIRAALEPIGFAVEAASPQDAPAAIESVHPKFVLLSPCIPQTERGKVLAMLERFRDRITVFQLKEGWIKEVHKLIASGSAAVN